MCKFRISAHRLPIESGRYLKIERVNRKCIECNKVGDEMHYFLDCNEQQISTCRQTLFSTMDLLIPCFKSIPKSQLFYYLVCACDFDFLNLTANLVSCILKNNSN